MERLSGVDANLLYVETPSLHTHTMKVAVLEPGEGAVTDVEGVREGLRPRLPRLPPFRRQLVDLPWGFHHPVWITVDPDLSQHVFAVTAPTPGGPRELDAIVSGIASTPLDRSRPLWELWLVDGLEGGKIAAVVKIHHALADGVAVSELLANVMDSPGDEDVDADAPLAEPIPSAGRLLRDAFVDHLGQLRRLPGLLRRTATGLRAAGRQRRLQETSPPLPLLDSPQTILNGALTPARTFAHTSVPLAEVKAVKNAHGVTVGDVSLALVAGAVRDYLLARTALPATPLVAEVPASTRSEGGRRLGGNELSNIFTALRTDVADPAERLRATHETTRSAKELHTLMGAELYGDWAGYAPPRPFAGAMRLYSRLRLADRHRPPINVIVSSVPGPRESLGWAQAELVDIFSVGPVIEGVGLNVTLWSYVDRLEIGVLTCPELVPDPQEIADGMVRALAELSASAGERAKAASS